MSSATIRNEMADLEDLGYIFQPHTSAGRIPSDKGYRLYVDMLMEEKEHEITELRNTMLEKSDKVDQVLKQAAKVLAVNTNYATMVSAPVEQPEHIEVHSAFTGGSGTDCGSDRDEWKRDQEQDHTGW